MKRSPTNGCRKGCCLAQTGDLSFGRVTSPLNETGSYFLKEGPCDLLGDFLKALFTEYMLCFFRIKQNLISTFGTNTTDVASCSALCVKRFTVMVFIGISAMGKTMESTMWLKYRYILFNIYSAI